MASCCEADAMAAFLDEIAGSDDDPSDDELSMTAVSAQGPPRGQPMPLAAPCASFGAWQGACSSACFTEGSCGVDGYTHGSLGGHSSAPRVYVPVEDGWMQTTTARPPDVGAAVQSSYLAALVAEAAVKRRASSIPAPYTMCATRGRAVARGLVPEPGGAQAVLLNSNELVRAWRQLRGDCRQPRVIDLGCGDGAALRAMSEDEGVPHTHLVGVSAFIGQPLTERTKRGEVFVESKNSATRGFVSVGANLETLSLRTLEAALHRDGAGCSYSEGKGEHAGEVEGFDIVLSWLTFYHLVDPYRAVALAYSLLRPGGIMVLQGVPADRLLVARGCIDTDRARAAALQDLLRVRGHHLWLLADQHNYTSTQRRLRLWWLQQRPPSATASLKLPLAYTHHSGCESVGAATRARYVWLPTANEATEADQPPLFTTFLNVDSTAPTGDSAQALYYGGRVLSNENSVRATLGSWLQAYTAS